MSLESVGEPSLVPPPEPRTVCCVKCSEELPVDDAVFLETFFWCPEDAARRCVEILAGEPSRARRYRSARDFEEAAEILKRWTDGALCARARLDCGSAS